MIKLVSIHFTHLSSLAVTGGNLKSLTTQQASTTVVGDGELNGKTCSEILTSCNSAMCYWGAFIEEWNWGAFATWFSEREESVRQSVTIFFHIYKIHKKNYLVPICQDKCSFQVIQCRRGLIQCKEVTNQAEQFLELLSRILNFLAPQRCKNIIVYYCFDRTRLFRPNAQFHLQGLNK